MKYLWILIFLVSACSSDGGGDDCAKHQANLKAIYGNPPERSSYQDQLEFTSRYIYPEFDLAYEFRYTSSGGLNFTDCEWSQITVEQARQEYFPYSIIL